ncbi:ATP-binding protein [Nocardia rhizosphaerihabitans]|uniref:histidine kinase n=1 Tax=Nocardia rhizosphaerihabitans TaxID=1691570 RepID=A0ABQ2L323_9NOCA|nr:ATP-binding protein [Nocardia rhizosphaerihabitans]GGN99336.1 two-component sensor histidine kinase [Nocardia rhizosphaerihabitans]
MSNPDRVHPRLSTRLRGLRGRVMVAFIASASMVTLVLIASVYAISADYMQSQRERTVDRAVGVHAELLRWRLDDRHITGEQALAGLNLSTGTIAMLRWESRWSIVDADGGLPVVPPPVFDADQSDQGDSAAIRVTINGQPYLRASAPVDGSGDAVLYEFAPLLELESTLRMLRTILIACTVVALGIGAALGGWAAHHALSPLRQVARTASRIASGEQELRLAPSDDQDLSTTVESFNAMVDSLQHRIERERRLVSDLSHELRTPLTTLTTAATVLAKHRDELSERPRTALKLLLEETTYLRGLLDDMLALARVEAGIHRSDLAPLSVSELLNQIMSVHAIAPDVLRTHDPGLVRGRRLELERAIVNVLVNADRHGGGVTCVMVEREGADIVITIDDAGPGIPAADRERIFGRFVTASRSTAGTGIGLALVAETVTGHHGQIRCDENPGGGARFVMTLPAHEHVRHEIAK